MFIWKEHLYWRVKWNSKVILLYNILHLCRKILQEWLIQVIECHRGNKKKNLFFWLHTYSTIICITCMKFCFCFWILLHCQRIQITGSPLPILLQLRFLKFCLVAEVVAYLPSSSCQINAKSSNTPFQDSQNLGAT